MEEKVRSFIAVELPEALKNDIRKLVISLKSEGQNFVKWVDPNAIHLTLKFLGGVPSGKIPEIIESMQEAAGAVNPFTLEAKGLGVFPNPRRAQVAWVGVEGEIDKLLALQKDLESRLAKLGFAQENRPFVSHLTLARVRENASPADREKFGQLILNTKFATAHAIQVESISLMHSQLTRQGAIYTRMAVVGLKRLLSTNS